MLQESSAVIPERPAVHRMLPAVRPASSSRVGALSQGSREACAVVRHLFEKHPGERKKRSGEDLKRSGEGLKCFGEDWK